jgi:hypothetical protein
MECRRVTWSRLNPTQGTGTTVRFLLNRNLVPASSVTPDLVRKAVDFPWLSVEVVTESAIASAFPTHAHAAFRAGWRASL